MNTSHEVTVRPASPDDAADIALLAAQLGYPSDASQVRRRLSALQVGDDQTVLVAVRDRTVVGWLHAHVHESVVDERATEIAGLVVDERYRSSGIGRTLMAAAEAWARAHGCCSVRLRSNVKRNRAHTFYQQLGYEITKSQHAFRKPLP